MKTILYDRFGGTDVLRINDSGDTLANTDGILSATTLTGLGTAGITYNTNTETLNIDLGSGGDAFTLASTYANLTNVRTQGGADSVLVQTTTGHVVIDTGAGADTVTVGERWF